MFTRKINGATEPVSSDTLAVLEASVLSLRNQGVTYPCYCARLADGSPSTWQIGADPRFQDAYMWIPDTEGA